MDSEPRVGWVERVWRTEILQSLSVDVLGLTGLVAFGVGVWQLSGPATWMYGGVVLAGLSVLLSIDRARQRAKRGPS